MHPRIVAALAALLIVYSLVIMQTVAGFPKRGASGDIGNPVLTLELAASGEELSNLLDVKDYDARKHLRQNTRLDNFYIPVYATFFVAFLWMVGTPGIAWAGSVAIVIAAIADGVENYHIFAALDATHIQDATALAIRHPSLVKWFFLDVGILAIAVSLFQAAKPPFGRIATPVLALIMAASAGIGFVGLFDKTYTSPSVLLSSVLPIVCVVSLWGKPTRRA